MTHADTAAQVGRAGRSLYLRDSDGIGIELLSDPPMYFGGRQLDEG